MKLDPITDHPYPLIRSLVYATVIVLCLTGTLLAQTLISQPNHNGDYFSNNGTVRGQILDPHLAQGSLWRVVSLRLNCHSYFAVNSTVVRQFKKGQILQADIGRGGSDEVLRNVSDRNGKPWMRVRSNAGENYNCYVRANRQYIQPVTQQQ